MRLLDGAAAPAGQAADRQLVTTVRAAVAGDDRAVAAVVARFDRPLRGITRSFRLSAWDADDVIQSTWIEFLQHGSKLREPAAVSGWLATTARRHCLRVLQAHVREHLCEDPASGEAGPDGALDARMLEAEQRAALDGSLARLTPRQRELMQLLLDEPDLSYTEVARRLDLPVGSIGPTRARSLARLRRDPALLAAI